MKMQPKAIHLKGRPLAGGRLPAVCVPLVGRTREALLAELSAVMAKQPDVLEWRADFFEGIADTAAVLDVAARLRQGAHGTPILFTRRCRREGGEPIALSEDQVVALYGAVCAGGDVDLVDFEMGNEPAHVRRMRELTRASGTMLVLSFHDFERTPELDILTQRFAQAERLGADVAKVAVMPRGMEDVLTLLTATLQSSRTLAIPVVSMSMAGLGSVTRLCGAAFGSAMTFAVGQSGSAPGQMPIEDLNTVLAILRKAGGLPG